MLPAVRRGRPAYPDVLTPREWEVLALIKDGLTNPQIAERLGITESGARFHVSEILSKLGVESRREAALWPTAGGQRRWGFSAASLLRWHLNKVSLVQVARSAGAALLVATAIAFVLLALGVLTNDRRSGSAPTQEIALQSSTSEIALPGDRAAGTAPERWGNFVLTQDSQPLDRTVEVEAPRRDFSWPLDAGPWDHPQAKVTHDEVTARSDPRVPLLGVVPSGEEFLAASVLEDSVGTATVWVAYISGKELQQPDARQALTPDAGTIKISWSLSPNIPVHISPLRTPDKERNPNAQGQAVFLDRTEKVSVKGQPGVMRIYQARRGGDTYPYRTPSVAINWIEGDVLWSFQSFFLTLDQALRAAESIRETKVH
jgi:DNA-binding CsgD family transcriptional regulator